MVELPALWLPVLVSSVLVFIVSSIIHMAPLWHKNDYPRLPNEEKVIDALRPLAIPPGEYMMPRCSSMEEMRSPEFVEKLTKGPVMLMTVYPNKQAGMAGSLILWFIYSIIIGIFSASIASQALPAGAAYPIVFRITGATAFLAYSVALWQRSIWYRQSLGMTLKTTFDGLLYGLLTAGVFGWLWPQMV